MAMTLRLPDPVDTAIAARAAREGLSKHAAILKLLTEHADDDIAGQEHRTAVVAAADQGIARWGAVLDRLANA